MGVAQANLERNDIALENALAAKHLAEKHFGTTDFRYAKTLNSVAGVLERLDRDADALGFMQEASDIVERSLDKDDPVSVEARRNVEGMKNHIAAKRHRNVR